MYRFRLGNWALVGLLLWLATAVAACGGPVESSGPSMGDEASWIDGRGELPASIGAGESLDRAREEEPNSVVADAEPGPAMSQTGKWFLHNGEGLFGYGLTGGTRAPGDPLQFTLFGHDDEGQLLDREVRIRLVERDRGEAVIEEIVFVDIVKYGENVIFADSVPDTENARYTLYAEVLNDQGEVEDAIQSDLLVPAPEIGAALEMDRPVYSTADTEARLLLYNEGPTRLVFGEAYSVEKRVGGVWKVVPMDRAFPDIGLMLDPGESFEWTLSIAELDRGEYRVIKQLRAEGFDLEAVLAAEFAIES